MSRRTFAQVLAHQENHVQHSRKRAVVPIRAGICLSVFLPLATQVAEAQETCVVCSGPAAVYRCTIEKSEKLSRFGLMADKAIQTVCIKELARTGGHATCAVRREAGPVVCDGVQREIPLASLLDANRVAPPTATPAPTPAAVANPAPAAAPAPAVVAAQKPAEAKDGPPRTMQELAERTGEKSKKQFESVGDAASRTWDCMVSLFKKC